MGRRVYILSLSKGPLNSNTNPPHDRQRNPEDTTLGRGTM